MRRLRAALLGIAGIVLLGVLWEAYKAFAPAGGVVVDGHHGAAAHQRRRDAAPVDDAAARARAGHARPTGSPPLWLAVLQASAVHPRHRGGRLGGRRGRRPAARDAHAALPHRRVRAAAVGRAQPDRAADRARPAREALGLARAPRRVRLAGLDVGRPDRELPRVLPGLDRRPARLRRRPSQRTST